jgi:hypothetical protein
MRRLTFILAASVLLLLVYAPESICASTKDANESNKKRTYNFSWILEQGKAEPDTEILKVVISSTDTHFASGKRVPGTKDGVTITTHEQRQPDGKLKKYRRKEARRKGKGLTAFSRGGTVRIVGLNQNFAAVELPASAYYAIWDPLVWHGLVHWLPRIKTDSQTVKIPFIDVSTRVTGVASASRGQGEILGHGPGNPEEVQTWVLTGLGAKTLTLYISSQSRLVGVRDSGSTMLLKGWTWKPEAAPEEEKEEEKPKDTAIDKAATGEPLPNSGADGDKPVEKKNP